MTKASQKSPPKQASASPPASPPATIPAHLFVPAKRGRRKRTVPLDLENLARAIKKSGLKNQKIAAVVGVSKDLVEAWQSGKRDISRTHLRSLAVCLRTTEESLRKA